MTAGTGTARGVVAAAILAGNPDWDVRPYPWEPSNLSAGTAGVSVWRGDLARHTGPVGDALLEHTVTVNLYAPKTEGAPAEDELDGLFDSLMLALQAEDAATFTRAERMTFSRKFQGWQITLTLTSPNYYRNALN